MASTTGVNVLRYSALAAGVFYGLYHQASLSASAKIAAINREYDHKQSLIEKAKAEYHKKTAPKESKTENGDVIRDPDSPNFDLEAYLNAVAAESP